MTLAEAISYARAHQPAVREALARIQAQSAESRVPRAAWLPSLGATEQIFGATANNTTASYVGPSTFSIPRIGGTRPIATGNWQPELSTLVGLGLTQQVFDFGRIAAQSAAADALEAVMRRRAISATLDVTYAVEEAYYALLAARAVLRASQQAYDRSRTHRDWAQSGVRAGLRPPMDETRAEADLWRFETGRVQAETGVMIAQTVFAASVGVPSERLDAAEAEAQPRTLPKLDDAVAMAMHNGAEIAEARAQVDALRWRTKAIGAQTRPDVMLTASINGRAGSALPSGNGALPPMHGWIPNVPNWDAGLVLNWPIYDPSVSAFENAARAQETVARETLARIQQQNLAQVREAYEKLVGAQRALPALEKGSEASIANYAQADARFQAGMGTSVEIADAEAIRTQAQIRLALGQFKFAQARARLGRLMAEDN